MQHLATGTLNHSPIAFLFDFIDLVRMNFNREKIKYAPVKENAELLGLSINNIKNPETNEKVKNVKKITKKILKKYLTDLTSLYEYIQSTDTIIIKDAKMGWVTFLAGEDFGFITPKTGLKSFLLLLGLKMIGRYNGRMFGVNTPEMFLYTSKDCHVADIITHVYKWVAYKKDLPGLDPFSTQKLKSIMRANFSEKSLTSLSVVEAICVKDAIERDMEATILIEEIASEILNQDANVKFVKSTEKTVEEVMKEEKEEIPAHNKTSNPMKQQKNI